MKVLITGGAGFIGSNTARRFISSGHDVAILDDLSRRGAGENLDWLREAGHFEFIQGDVRNPESVNGVFRRTDRFDVVYHLAAQVAVTTSVANPRHDFEVNALGSLNVLEAARAFCPEAVLVYASTNKVYGGLDGVPIAEGDGRYQCSGLPNGIPVSWPLDLHSPYGCSKGAADQYFHDYHRIYGLRTVVLRQSCIYGYRQFGMEDQGWVAWFTIAASLGRGITIFGDGKQVRDLLFVDDLIDLYELVLEKSDKSNGQIFNVGGGPSNQASLLEVIELIQKRVGHEIEIAYDEWRPGDQRVCVLDISETHAELGWQPKVDVEKGVNKLTDWVLKNQSLFRL